MAGIGNEIFIGHGVRLQPSDAADILQMQRDATDVSRINHTGSPEGAVSANPSSLCHDPVSGNVYFKQSGTGNTGWILISSGATTLVWQSIAASQMAVVNNGYFCAGGGDLAVQLPAVSSVGDEVQVVLAGSNSFTITQGAGQSIIIGNQITTAGVGGSAASTGQGDWIKLVCMTANLTWVSSVAQGNLTVV